MSLIENEDLATGEFLNEAFKFWFNDNNHIRSPFPEYIHQPLQQESTKKFRKWLNHVHPDAKDEINDEILAEKFEEILFETALNLVLTDDERITILYPFLPRLGDKIKANDNSESVISGRVIKKENDKKYLRLSCTKLLTDIKWETSIELPE